MSSKSTSSTTKSSSSSATPAKSDKELKKEKEKKEKEDKDREKRDRKEKEKQERKAAKEARAKAKLDKKASRKSGRDRSGSDVSVDDYTSDTDTDPSSDLSSSLERSGKSSSGLGGSSNQSDLNQLLGNSSGGSSTSASATGGVVTSGLSLTGSGKKNDKGNDKDKDKEKQIYEGDLFTSENFLIALADTDHLGPAIKSMFESNKEKEVIDSLNNYILDKERDIEKICGDNHESFINSVTTFLGLKEDNLTLKQSIIHLNYELQELGTKYTNKAEEMLACKRTKDNIRGTKEIINNCQYAIQLGMKVEEFVKNKKYYQAIKNMDQLHNVYLKRLSDFQFARNMDSNIPVIKENIKKLVKAEFNSWMVEIKEKSAKIGRFGMIQSAKRLEKEREINPLKIKTMFGENEEVWDKILEIPYNENTSAIGSLSSTQTPLSPSFVSVNDTYKDDINQKSPFDEVNMNFHPLYQCLFIYSSLGQLEEFQAYYTQNRLLQFHMVVQPKEHGQVWESFLQQIAGYFMVESKVIDSTHPHLSKTTINECWNMALVKITSVLQELFTHCQDTHSLISFKKFVLVFTNTLSFYSYHVQPLLYLLDTMKERYCQFAIREGVELFTRILESESSVNLVVDTANDYRQLILSNQLDPDFTKEFGNIDANDGNNIANDDNQLLTKILPKSFTFSKLVPQFYTLLKKFISEFYEFTDQLSENEDFIIRSTDTLIRKINEVLYNFLTMSSTVPQVIQIVVNLDHLLVACQFFKEYLNALILGDSKTTDHSLTASNKVNLSSSNQLYTTRGLGEKLIIKLSERKIEDLMSSSANINWFPAAADDRPNDYIDVLITFLEFNLTFIQPLSHQLREDFITKSFKKISENLQSILFSDSIKKFNLCGVKNFNADLKRIEDFAKMKAEEKERTTTSSRNLVGYFFELRQVVNLLLSENPEDYGDQKIRSTHYNLLTNVKDLILLFQKYKEESKSFTQPKEVKDRNLKIANALRKFREME